MNKPKAVLNIMPDEIWKWKHVERELEEVAGMFNFREIRTSILQESDQLEASYRQAARYEDDLSLDDLFLRINGADQLALRPESTITILRSEMARRARDEVQKFWYNGPVFRRSGDAEHYQIHQFGFEILGNPSIIADVEVMKAAVRICRRLGLRNPRIEATSYGCRKCRPRYAEAMSEHLKNNPMESCRSCRTTALFNPLQAHHHVEGENYQQLLEDAPRITDYLCEDCRDQLDSMMRLLSNLMIDHRLDPYLARPFGYYNRTVFNITIEQNGEQVVLGGGGRYDYLSEAILDEGVPGVGFTFDLLKVIRSIEIENLFHEPERPFTVFIGSLSEGLDLSLLQIEQELHDNQFHTMLLSSRSEAEWARDEARKHGCSVALLLDEESITRGKVRLVNLVKEYEETIDLSEILYEVQRLHRAIGL